MSAYNIGYLDDAMNTMAEMMDYVSSDCHMDMDEFFRLFISSGYAELFGKGVPNYIAGQSGIELAKGVFAASGYEIDYPEPKIRFYRTSAYWCGWILAYYQWKSSMPFRDILKYISFEKLNDMYTVFHEASEDYFADALDEIIASSHTPTKLQTLRKSSGLSQKQLADKSSVSLRAIQQYEQRQKDINKAQASALANLAKTLGCKMEDLIEYN